MPIYEYACRDCNHRFEALVRSDTTPECPQCHSIQLEKQLSVFATTGASASVPDLPPSPCGSGACCMPGGGCGFQ
ncbi:MAG: zinc ribbon domain-containing protein [Rhodoferax sp.]|jgi:putative FmdB family regulatory protein|uniref:FmdB family zinc ribbon protein n=1 Tax=Rhodoferax sp. TaxID=50421 RepID=UPI001B59B262|nr:zinc ribbon domain-containing protein [Rhodoferax sp.]MBP9150033.1 zinc ribbon domain-containing protein [Rhodoferax sp.]MBP9735568.1 zinc ribbon domain-containing protein [Rhodoferax sp.]